LLSPEALIFSTTHKGLASSPDRRCFSARSDGLILSEGAAAVLLRPLADAQRDNDEILAVIKGTALNRGPGGPTESNPGGAREASRASPLARQSVHVEVVRHALRRADVPMRSISYVEAALSGHPLYDGLALSGLKRAVQSHAADDWSCTIGSVESNVGHGVAVSALTQLVKVIFQLRHRAFAPSIRAATELSDCGLDGSPFRIAHSRQNWNRPMVAEGEAVREYPRRALITSYGSGGTHGCAVVEEYDPSEPVSA
jgi:acyl transferase domain-containing protein